MTGSDASADVAGPARAAGTVQSLDRALDLIETLAASEVALGLGEVAGRAGLAQGTAHRLLHSLQVRGYVRRDSSRRYSVGLASLALADAVQRSLARQAQQFLGELVAWSGETANLAVLEGDDAVYVAQVPSPHTLRMFAEVGRHVPLHSTAVGKVLLAAMPVDRARSLLRRAGTPRSTPRTLTDLDELLADLAVVRHQGWAADEEEQEVGVRCVAVPVTDGSRVAAAMSLSGPAERFAGVRTDGLLDRLTDVATRLSAALS